MKKWLMKMILHPSAYMVWHAAGEPEEWKWWTTSEGYRLQHKPTKVIFWVGNGAAFFDEILDQSEVIKTGAIGCFDRYLVWPRIAQVVRYLKQQGDSKHLLFLKMTQLTGKQ